MCRAGNRLQQRLQAIARFLALRRIGRADRYVHVIPASGHVVDRRGALSRHHQLVDRLHFLLAVLAKNADDPLRVVNARDHVHEDAAGVGDGLDHVVGIDRGRVLAFLFPRQNGPPAGLIGPCAKAGVVDPRGALDVLRRHLHLQLQGLGSDRRVDPLRHPGFGIGVVWQIRAVLHPHFRPDILKPLDLLR